MRILSLAPLAGTGIDLLRSLGELEVDAWNAHVPVKLHSPDELVARLEGTSVLIVEADHVPAGVLERAQLTVVGVCRGEPANVDVPAATKFGIAVVRTPARNADAVAELAIGLVLALIRNVVTADDDVRAARWIVDGRIPQQRYLGRELSTLTVGLVGCGAVGRATARKLTALGARVIGFDPFAGTAELQQDGIEPVEALDDLVARADVVSVHTPLNEATRGMIGAREIALMKPGAWFVNTARFSVADGDALVEALRTGHLAGAAFDHFENEYLPQGHALTTLPNVILTPHIGGTTIETIERHTTLVALGIAKVLSGNVPDSLVNPEVLAQKA